MRSLPVLVAAFCLFFLACEYSGSGNRESEGETGSVSKNRETSATQLTHEKLPDSVSDMGKQVFLAGCGTCHNHSAKSLAPGPEALGAMTARSVLAALDQGKMRGQAAKLTEEQRRAVAQWVTNKLLTENNISKEVYLAFSIADHHDTKYDLSGWAGDLAGTGYRTAAQAGIDSSNLPSLKLKWAFAFPDASQVRGRPGLVENWLIVGSEFGDVYAINTQTGRPGWNFAADASIRGAVSILNDADKLTAYFADYSTNVYAVDVRTGKLLWKTRAGYHPQSVVTGSVAVYGNRVFIPISSIEVLSAKNPEYDCCTSSGGVVALDAKTGSRIWQYKVIAEEAKKAGKKKNGKNFYGPSGAPVWCSPTVDAKRGLLYIGTGENYTNPATKTSDAIQALDMQTGRLAWSFQATHADTWNLACPLDPNCPEKAGPGLDFGMAPVLVHQADGSDVLVAGQKSGVVYALTPNGKLIWQRRIGKGGALGGVHWGMAADEKYVYATNADNLMAIDQTDSLVSASPGVYALEVKTGRLVWATPTPECDTSAKACIQANSAAPTLVPGIVFAAALDGHLRAYSARDGKIVWDFNSVKHFETTDGIRGMGGAMDGPGPLIANGMLFVNSGYGWFGEMPGNLLLAFEVKKNK
jgi:polyvinyl alcohol dehydrogenase (cytochrome)